MNGDLKNQGFFNYNVTSTDATADSNGKIGACMKINWQTNLEYIPNFNTTSLTIGGWFKFNQSEIQSRLSQYTYTSTANAPTGNLIGNTSYGGIGIVWNGNNLYSSQTLQTVDVRAVIRTNTISSQGTSGIRIEFDTWVHIMMVWDVATRKLRLYKNGVLFNQQSIGAFSDGVSRKLTMNYKAIYGGNGPSAEIPFCCNDIRIYDDALTPEQIKHIAQGLIVHYPLSPITETELSGGNPMVDNEPYVLRKTACGSDYHSGFSTLVGGTICFNQLLPIADVDGNAWPSGSTRSYDSATSTVTFNLTMPSEGYGYLRKNFASQTGHVYLIAVKVNNVGGTTITHVWSKANNASTTPPGSLYNGYKTYFAIQKSTSNASLAIFGVSGAKNTVVSVTMSNFMIIDLTLMFGSTIADYINSLEQTGVGNGYNWLKQYLPKDYYPYNAGELQHVNALTHITTEKNLWGGSRMLESFKNANITGFTYTSTTAQFSGQNITGIYVLKNFPFKSNTSYTFVITFSNSNNGVYSNLRIYYTDNSYSDITAPSNTANTKQTVVFTTSSSKTVLGLCGIWGSSTTTLYYNESGLFEGTITTAQFQPYVEHSCALDSTLTLRGVPKLDTNNKLYFDGDTYSADGTVTRNYKLLHLGDYTWTLNNTNDTCNRFISITTVPGCYAGVTNNINNFTDGGWTQGREITAPSSTINALDIRPSNSRLIINLKKTVFDGTETEFNTWCQGKYIVYKLETPTTEYAAPYKNPLPVDSSGVEEFITNSVVPVGHITTYVKSQIQGRSGMTYDRLLDDCNNETIVYDCSGYKNNGVLYTTDGTGSFITNGESPKHNSSLNVHSTDLTNAKAGTAYVIGNLHQSMSPNQLTVAFWCYARAGYNGHTGNGVFCTTNIVSGDSTATDFQASAFHHRDSTVNINRPADNSQLLLPITFISNEWHHYAFTYDGQTAKSYRDGALQGTKSWSEATVLDPFRSVLIGFSRAGNVWRRNDNIYSDFRVYVTALSADDIIELYTTPTYLANN